MGAGDRADHPGPMISSTTPVSRGLHKNPKGRGSGASGQVNGHAEVPGGWRPLGRPWRLRGPSPPLALCVSSAPVPDSHILEDGPGNMSEGFPEFCEPF